MVTLEQIRRLDGKVQKAVRLISELRKENGTLKQKLEDYRSRIEEMEVLISKFKSDQNEIEQGILNALQQLDKLEDSVAEKAQPEMKTLRETEDEALAAPSPGEEGGEPAKNPSELDIF
ncbi:MAG: cell division protein ZapB [Spirochaetota bacterium]